MVFERRRGEDTATLALSHKDLDDDAKYALKSDPETGGWTLLGAAKDHLLSPERQQIREVLCEATQAMTPKEVAEVIGKSVNATKFLMWQMAQQGTLTSSRGRYAIPLSDGQDSPNRTNFPNSTTPP
jgi:hypothetical protein